METPSSDDAHPAEDDLPQVLARVRRLREQKDFDAARDLLETALTRWSGSQTLKDLLLQTEKDQLATRGHSIVEIDEGGFDTPWQAGVVVIVSILFLCFALYMTGDSILYMARFGFEAQKPVYSRGGTRIVHYVPVHLALTVGLLLSCFFAWILKLAFKNFR